MKYPFFLKVIRVFLIFVNEGSMTNSEVYQGFHNDKKVEEHWSNGLGPGLDEVHQDGLKVLHLWHHSQQIRTT